jgi:hypothetical protein
MLLASGEATVVREVSCVVRHFGGTRSLFSQRVDAVCLLFSPLCNVSCAAADADCTIKGLSSGRRCYM